MIDVSAIQLNLNLHPMWVQMLLLREIIYFLSLSFSQLSNFQNHLKDHEKIVNMKCITMYTIFIAKEFNASTQLNSYHTNIVILCFGLHQIQKCIFKTKFLKVSHYFLSLFLFPLVKTKTLTNKYIYI
jgi:hypothetical protein